MRYPNGADICRSVSLFAWRRPESSVKFALVSAGIHMNIESFRETQGELTVTD